VGVELRFGRLALEVHAWTGKVLALVGLDRCAAGGRTKGNDDR
jgi:hypothetical protein